MDEITRDLEEIYTFNSNTHSFCSKHPPVCTGTEYHSLTLRMNNLDNKIRKLHVLHNNAQTDC